MTSEDALRIGLVSEVVAADALLPRVLDVARKIAAGPPLATARLKRNLNAADELTYFSEALDREAEHQ